MSKYTVESCLSFLRRKTKMRISGNSIEVLKAVDWKGNVLDSVLDIGIKSWGRIDFLVSKGFILKRVKSL